jgi:hypothetical protein
VVAYMSKLDLSVISPCAKIWHIVWALCGVLIVSVAVAAPSSPMLIIHADLPPEQAPKNTYRAELYKLLLDVTRPEFGDYQLQSYTGAIAARRQALLMSEGVQLNVHWASPGTPIAEADVIKIPVDIQRGLLGYRVCLTTAPINFPWADVVDLKSLELVRIGQVDSWPDSDIYTFNRLNLVGTPSFDGLFEMLAANRFDCLALGVDEVGTIYREKKAKFANMRIEESLIIHYEFPVYMYVSAKRPDIAKRLRRGFEIIQHNGQFDGLFERYVARDLVTLKLQSRRIICLKSPYIALAGQCSQQPALPSIYRP